MLLVVATTFTKAEEDGQAGLIPDLCNQTHPTVVLQMSQATINNFNIRVELEKKEKIDSPCNSSLPATVPYTPLLYTLYFSLRWFITKHLENRWIGSSP